MRDVAIDGAGNENLVLDDVVEEGWSSDEAENRGCGCIMRLLMLREAAEPFLYDSITYFVIQV